MRRQIYSSSGSTLGSRSEVLPASNYPLPVPEAGEARRASGYPEVQDEDDDPKIDTAFVRQMQLSSNMFGRSAEVKPEVAHDPSRRLMPNDFVWHSHPEKPLSPRMEAKTHSDRAYEQKCSQVLEYQSPEVRKMHAAQKMQEKKEDTNFAGFHLMGAVFLELLGHRSLLDDLLLATW
eukprot:s4288_g7.t1